MDIGWVVSIVQFSSRVELWFFSVWGEVIVRSEIIKVMLRRVWILFCREWGIVEGF